MYITKPKPIIPSLRKMIIYKRNGVNIVYLETSDKGGEKIMQAKNAHLIALGACKKDSLK
jgi:hypothetical protein